MVFRDEDCDFEDAWDPGAFEGEKTEEFEKDDEPLPF
jgi:hypothetical protein